MRQNSKPPGFPAAFLLCGHEKLKARRLTNMSTTTPAPLSTPDAPPANLHDLIRDRWSPRQFIQRAVETEKMLRLFEAARWAASCFNEQPWRFVLATKEQPAEFARVLGLLMEKNQQWAQGAWALGFSAGKRTFSHNGLPDRFGLYDAGAACANMALEATHLGIRVHFMGGFDPERARSEFNVPADFDIGAAFAIGYIDESAVQPGPRTRRPLGELVFSGNWGQAAQL
jgi:nitroreductase